MATASRLITVETALRDGRHLEAAGILDAALKNGARPPVALLLQVGLARFNAGDALAGEAWARRGLIREPRNPDLLFLLGAALRRQRRLDEALKALQASLSVRPGVLPVLLILVDLHSDRGEGDKAEAILRAILKARPQDPVAQYKLGRALRQQGRLDESAEALEAAITLDPRPFDVWRDRVTLASERQRHDEALAVLDRADGARPSDPQLAQLRGLVLRRAGRLDEQRAFLEALLIQNEAAWIHRQLATLADLGDPTAGQDHLRRAVELEPENPSHALLLAMSLQQSQAPGDLDEAHRLAVGLTTRGDGALEKTFVLSSIFGRTADIEHGEALGDFAAMGRHWVAHGQYAALLEHMPRVRSDADRRELVHQHRLWGQAIERRVGGDPIPRPPRGPRDKLRIGFLSSDLRDHAVGYFALPLFQHADRSRQDLFVYSHAPFAADGTQKLIAEASTYRQAPGLSDKDAAQVIANDRLDILIDLGATTQFNRAELAAYRPAPVQASWMGYPHSTGLSAIDHMILDPHVAPTAGDLLLERPLLMPRSWIVLGERAFRADQPAATEPPAMRNGHITFGTANNPLKYTRDVLSAWARIVAATPGSRFLIVRPEAAAAVFKANIVKAFAIHGVAADRLEFAATQGQHLPWYDHMDISLDTFPQTGGTTTCEALWMGVPVVSLRGPAIFERLSHSILTNAGLTDLSVETVEDYVTTAMALAVDLPRLAALRRTLRTDLRAGPLGDTRAFTQDFYALLKDAAS